MLETNNLRKALVSIFNKITPNVFYSQANFQVAFPYIVFELNLVVEENYGLYSLELDIWDKGNNLNNIENICDKLESLDGRIYNDEDLNFIMYFENRNIIQDSDKELKRRRLVFSLKLYKKGD